MDSGFKGFENTVQVKYDNSITLKKKKEEEGAAALISVYRVRTFSIKH